MGAGVSELRIDYGPGYRVYFKKQGRTIVVLPAGGEVGYFASWKSTTTGTFLARKDHAELHPAMRCRVSTAFRPCRIDVEVGPGQTAFYAHCDSYDATPRHGRNRSSPCCLVTGRT